MDVELSRPGWAVVTGALSAVGTGVKLKQRYTNEQILRAPWRVKRLFATTCLIQGALSAGCSLPLNDLPAPGGSGSLLGVTSTVTFAAKPSREEEAAAKTDDSNALVKAANFATYYIYWFSGKLVYEMDKEFAKLKMEKGDVLRAQAYAAARGQGARNPVFESVHSFLAKYVEHVPVLETRESMQGELAAALELTKKTAESQKSFTPLLILIINWGLREEFLLALQTLPLPESPQGLFSNIARRFRRGNQR